MIDKIRKILRCILPNAEDEYYVCLKCNASSPVSDYPKKMKDGVTPNYSTLIHGGKCQGMIVKKTFRKG